MRTSAVFRRRAGFLPVLFVSALGLSGCGGGSEEMKPEKAQEAVKTSSQESAGAFFKNKTPKKATSK
jgi:hypothetical protein